MIDAKLLKRDWKLAGYDPRKMGSATAAPPPQLGYVRGYHLTPEAHALSNIALGRIKITRFSDANDPFEVLGLHFGEWKTRKLVRAFKNLQNATTGLLCFSGNWTNPVLWSHYADKHRGMCLGFDVEKTEAQPVEYQDERLLEKLDEVSDPSLLPMALQRRLLKTKSHHWRYEEEFRRFVTLSSAVRDREKLFWPFDNCMRLIEVVLGPESRLDVLETRAMVAAMTPGVSVFRSRLAFKSFRVVVDEKSLCVRPGR